MGFNISIVECTEGAGETFKNHQICQKLAKNEVKPCSTCLKNPFFGVISGTQKSDLGYNLSATNNVCLPALEAAEAKEAEAA